MNPFRPIVLLSLLSLLVAGCAGLRGPQRAELGPEQIAACEQLKLDPNSIALLEAKPLYRFTEQEVNDYLGYLQVVEPDLPKRVVRIGRKNLNQPYDMYLLGEFPYEIYDPQPLYCLRKSDCVVFSEHSYAMALADDWPSFFAALQRIRYKDGRVSALCRNHYTVADWDRNNRWLVRDVTDEIAPGRALPFRQTLNRAKFFKSRYKVDSDVPVENVETTYVPIGAMEEAAKNLRDGDFVNVIYGTKEQYASHTGLIAIGPDGAPDFLHSTPPKVREEPILEYMRRTAARNPEREKEGKAVFVGFKFLRLEADPMANLRKIDGPDAPRVTLGPLVKQTR